MFNINRTLKKGVRYPDKELLCDYQDLHFADLVSTPAVRAMSGIDNTKGFLSVFFGRQKEKWSKIFCCSVNFCEIGKELSWFFSLLICPQNTFKELLCHTNYKEGI